jgi:tetratricopeptide (TPR) repeat protein
MDVTEAISRLAVEEDATLRQELLESVPELKSTATVERMHAEVLRLVYANADQAERIAGAAEWIAAQLGTGRAVGLARRASGHVAYTRTRHEEAVRLYREAAEELEAAGEDVEVARTLSGGLQPLSLLGRYDEAFLWAEKARSIFEAHGDELRLARLATNIGNVLYRQDRYGEALEQYQRAYDLFQTRGEPLDVTAVLSNLAVCHISLANFEEALSFYRLARGHAAEHGQDLLVAGADYNVAYLHYLRGDYLRAMELYQGTRLHCAKVGDAYHEALCDLDESEMCLELNLNQEARYLARDAAAGFERLGMPYEWAKALANLALADSRRGDFDASLRGFRQARKLFRQEHNQLWPGLLDLYEAIVYRQLERPADALRRVRRAQRRIPADWLPGKALLCLLLEGQLFFEADQVTQARALCMQALRQNEDQYLPSKYHPWFLLAQVEEADRNWDAAYEACRKAAAAIETLRTRLSGEEMKISFLKDKLSVYESLVALCLNRRPEGPMVEEAVLHIQQAKSRVLADQMAGLGRAPTEIETAPGDLEELRRQLHWHYRRIEMEAEQDREGASARIRFLQQEARERESRLARSQDAVFCGDGHFTARGLLDAIPADALLLEFFRVRERFFACLMGQGNMEMIPLGETHRVRQLLHLLQFQLAKFRLGTDYLMRFSGGLRGAVENHLRALYTELIGPLRASLHCRHLIVAPHSFLHHLPFHALLDGDRYLIDDYSISYAPSASVFALCASRSTASALGAPLVFGVPDDGTPFVLEEARTVVERLPGARLFLGEEATGEVFRQLAPDASYIHVATHGVFRRDNPLFSSLRLGNSHLSLFDLYRMRLSAELVTLSGCSTGLHAIEGGDELVGLVRGLLSGGARSAVVSLWDVNDSSTACLMGAFYNEMRRWPNRAEALRQAMLSLREYQPHPYFWAPFLVVGKYWGTTLTSEKSFPVPIFP